MIDCTKEIDVARPPDQVFAFIDAEDNAPRWLNRCVAITRTSPGEKAVGTRLRYVYKQPGRRGAIDGVVTEYDPGKRIGMKYTARLFDVTIDFGVAPNGKGTHVTEHVSIAPKALVAKLMAPVLRRVTRWQAEKNMTSLKRLLETPG